MSYYIVISQYITVTLSITTCKYPIRIGCVKKVLTIEIFWQQSFIIYFKQCPHSKRQWNKHILLNRFSSKTITNWVTIKQSGCISQITIFKVSQHNFVGMLSTFKQRTQYIIVIRKYNCDRWRKKLFDFEKCCSQILRLT